jgi:cyclic pyranopterin phosphate synthase
LYADQGVDLRDQLRLGATDAELAALVRQHWSRRTDRGAEARLAIPERAVLHEIQGLRADPHREMHTRGG